MNQQEWVKQYMCTPEPLDVRLLALAQEYHARCEAYDRTVCTGPIVDGGVMPTTYREFGLINRHAYRVRKEILGRAEAAGFTKQQIQQAITAAEAC